MKMSKRMMLLTLVALSLICANAVVAKELYAQRAQQFGCSGECTQGGTECSSQGSNCYCTVTTITQGGSLSCAPGP